ncbi:hypothetical protein AMK16_26325 [Streptomyces sp. CB00455]|nr:hypothetical protein AMK16_26325 [Streptomyces sp. CB00455]
MHDIVGARTVRTMLRIVTTRCALDAGMSCTPPPADVHRVEKAPFHPMDIAVDPAPTGVLATGGSPLHSMQPEHVRLGSLTGRGRVPCPGQAGRCGAAAER